MSQHFGKDQPILCLMLALELPILKLVLIFQIAQKDMKSYFNFSASEIDL